MFSRNLGPWDFWSTVAHIAVNCHRPTSISHVSEAMATLMLWQARKGGYAAWDPPMSYSSVAFMNADLGIYRRTAGRCFRDGDLYDAIVCPLGYLKRQRDEVEVRCSDLGMRCPIEKGYKCLCSPCRKAEELEVVLASG